MMTRNEKIVKIAELNKEIVEKDYEMALIRAGLKTGNITSLKIEKHLKVNEMYKLAREVDIIEEMYELAREVEQE